MLAACHAGGAGSETWTTLLGQQFSTGVPQEFLKHAIPDDVVKVTDLFSLTVSDKKK